MENEELLKELENRFKKIKSEMGIKSSLEELDNAFFIKDFILKEGFISERLSRQINYKIVDTYMGWNEYFHSLIMPNPQNMLNISESKIFSKEEKKEIVEMMKKIMQISSKNNLILITKDKKGEGKFLDEGLEFWESEFKEKIARIMKKINKEWGNTE